MARWMVAVAMLMLASPAVTPAQQYPGVYGRKLLITDSGIANSSLAGSIARRFDLDYVAICLPQGAEWIVFESGSRQPAINPAKLSAAFDQATIQPGVDAGVRSQASAPTLILAGHEVRVVPLRFGTKSIGLLAAAGRPVESGTLDARVSAWR